MDHVCAQMHIPDRIREIHFIDPWKDLFGDAVILVRCRPGHDLTIPVTGVLSDEGMENRGEVHALSVFGPDAKDGACFQAACHGTVSAPIEAVCIVHIHIRILADDLKCAVETHHILDLPQKILRARPGHSLFVVKKRMGHTGNIKTGRHMFCRKTVLFECVHCDISLPVALLPQYAEIDIRVFTDPLRHSAKLFIRPEDRTLENLPFREGVVRRAVTGSDALGDRFDILHKMLIEPFTEGALQSCVLFHSVRIFSRSKAVAELLLVKLHDRHA